MACSMGVPSVETITPFSSVTSEVAPSHSALSSVLILSKFALAYAVIEEAEVIARMEISTFFLIIANVLINVCFVCFKS